MKSCTFCGKEYSDEVEVCSLDGRPLERIGGETLTETIAPAAESPAAISARESLFWEQMSFRKFAALMIRLQALWLLFYAVVDATYLPRYFRSLHYASIHSVAATDVKIDLFLAVLRILLHVAAALSLIQHAERFLSWLIKDWVRK